jgi:intracellular sulfur oxidation DsrE/DsrF family protein
MRNICKNAKTSGVIASTLVLLFFILPVMADFDNASVKNKIVIQVSTDDPTTQTIALNNAVNLQQEYGMDNILIEVVAYGPGLGLLTQGGKQSTRVKSLAMQNIRFSACGNTMAKVAKKTGKKPLLVDGVTVVKAGVSRILELQQHGYAYIRP